MFPLPPDATPNGAQTPMLLAGEWVLRPRGMQVNDPEDGTVIGTVPWATAEDADVAVTAAHAAKAAAKAIPPHERAAILARTAVLVEADAERLARFISTEGIKTIREARREVARCAGTLRLSAQAALVADGNTIPFGQQAGGERRTGYVRREPAGIVVAITPFNDPLNLVAHKIGPAIAAGNAIVLKPHERTPLSALALARHLVDAGLPPGVLQILTGTGAEVGAPLVADPRVRVVSFTGGRATGERIARMAGVKRLSMELGGNCATIVMADADVAQAVEACTSGAFWAAGQNCLHVQRLYIHRDQYGAFKNRFLARAQAYRLGSKRDEATDMGCLIDGAAAARVEAVVRSALAVGATKLTGGERCGTRMPPTVLEGVPADHELVREEVFGPVTMLAPFDTWDEAVAMANAPDYGLQAAVFTNDMALAFDAVERLEAGAVIINDSTDYRLDSMPFGGIKGSGIGREGVEWAVQELSELKVSCFVPQPAGPRQHRADG